MFLIETFFVLTRFYIFPDLIFGSHRSIMQWFKTVFNTDALLLLKTIFFHSLLLQPLFRTHVF